MPRRPRASELRAIACSSAAKVLRSHSTVWATFGVTIVESTRRFVLASVMAARAVSRSWISPRNTTSGSCRMTRRSAVA
jgi:hypothetical protein